MTLYILYAQYTHYTHYTHPMYLVTSCCFALGVNISNYMVLGKTSPLTYQVLGHMKTILILVLGVVIFNVSNCTKNEVL